MEKKIFKLSLTFHDDELEKAFQESKITYQQTYFDVTVMTITFFSIAAWVINPTDNSLKVTTLVVYPIHLVILWIFYFFIKKKKKDWVGKALGILVVYGGIGLMEGTYPNLNKWNGTMFFCYGMLVQTLILSPLLARMSWCLNLFSLIVLILYCALRYTTIQGYQDIRYFPLFIFIFLLFLCPICGYYLEKKDRLAFYQAKTDELSLTCFRDLLKDVIPSSIIITRRNELLFSNKESNRILSNQLGETVLEDLRHIQLKFKANPTDKNDSPRNKATPISEKMNMQKIYEKLNSEEHSETTNLQTKNLLEVINEIGSYDETPKPSKIGFHSYFGEMKNRRGYSSSENNHYYFDIKVSNIIWERFPATIILLSEDQSVHKMKVIKEQSRYKDRLLATVSHDLRTPLNGIIGMLDSVILSISDNQINKCLTVALRSAHLLLSMINDILDFSQISNGKLRLNFVPFNVSKVVKEVTKLIKFQAKKKGLNFQLIDELGKNSSEFSLRNDPNRLKQILLNLLGNALKFTSVGAIKITMSRLSERVARFSVEDTGCGIKKNDIPKLFKLFGKLESDESLRINEGGVGLGLAISQSLVKLLNKDEPDADIKVTSVYGKGSCFYFNLFSHDNIDTHIVEIAVQKKKLPASQRISKDSGNIVSLDFHNPNATRTHLTTTSDDNSEITLMNLTKKYILIVDDDQINIIVISNYLSKEPYLEFDVACNGKEALDLIMKKAKQNIYYDAILMDCNMPVMDGFEATRRILKLVKDNEIPYVPIIAATANASQTDFDSCFEAGMVEYISKPFKRQELIEKLENVFVKR